MKFVQYRRKREGRTDYRARLKMLTSKQKRLVIRFTLKNVIAQIIEYGVDGDKVILSASSKELKALGWKYSCKNTSATYLMGYLIGKKAQHAKITDVIYDIGLKGAIKKGKVFAALKGAVDSGLKIPHSADAFPSEDRIMGKHVEAYAKEKSNSNQFSEYAKNGAKPENMSKVFAEVKAKIK